MACPSGYSAEKSRKHPAEDSEVTHILMNYNSQEGFDSNNSVHNTEETVKHIDIKSSSTDHQS